LAFATQAWSTTLLEENIDYAAGQLLTDNGWTIHGTDIPNPITVTMPGLTALRHPGSGIGNAIQINTGQDVSKAYTAQTSGSVYYSAMINVSNANAAILSDYLMAFQPNVGINTFNGRLFINPSGSGFKMGVVKSTDGSNSNNTSTTVFSLNTTYTVVVKYTIVAGTLNDEIKLFVLNPLISIPLTEPTPEFTYLETTKADPPGIGAILLKQGAAATASTETIDGIRVATTWSDLFPVSSTPAIFVYPSSLSGFNYTVGSGPSTAQTFIISGSNLTNDISLAASTNYEVSLSSGSGYTTPLTFEQTGGTTTIYARLKSGLPSAVYNTEAITATSSGAINQTVICNGVVSAIEPATYVTGFTTGTVTTTSINLTWTDATAEGYLIKGSGSSFADIIAPTDGNAITNTTLARNVAQGIQTYTFTGLEISGNYFFKIYPYNGSDLFINYKTDGSVPETTGIADTSALLLEENFDYVTNTYLHDNNWNAYSSAGTLPPKVGASGLTYSGTRAIYPSVSGLDGVTQGNGEDINRTFFTQTSGSVYCSFLMNVTSSPSANSDYVFHFGTNLWTGSYYGRVFIQKDASTTNFRMGLSKNASAASSYTGYTYTPGTTYLVVVKYSFVAGVTNDEAKLFINPAFPGAEPTADLTVSSGETTADAFNIGGFGIRQTVDTPIVHIDGIRVGTNWTDIFPVAITPDTPVAAIYLEDGSVKLSWAAISGATAGYKVYGSDDPDAVFPSGWTWLTDPDFISGLTYTYTGTENWRFFKVIASN